MTDAPVIINDRNARSRGFSKRPSKVPTNQNRSVFSRLPLGPDATLPSPSGPHSADRQAAIGPSGGNRRVKGAGAGGRRVALNPSPKTSPPMPARLPAGGCLRGLSCRIGARGVAATAAMRPGDASICAARGVPLASAERFARHDLSATGPRRPARSRSPGKRALAPVAAPDFFHPRAGRWKSAVPARRMGDLVAVFLSFSSELSNKGYGEAGIGKLLARSEREGEASNALFALRFMR